MEEAYQGYRDGPDPKGVPRKKGENLPIPEEGTDAIENHDSLSVVWLPWSASTQVVVRALQVRTCCGYLFRSTTIEGGASIWHGCIGVCLAEQGIGLPDYMWAYQVVTQTVFCGVSPHIVTSTMHRKRFG
jgi:hypothetical protein